MGTPAEPPCVSTRSTPRAASSSMATRWATASSSSKAMCMVTSSPAAWACSTSLPISGRSSPPSRRQPKTAPSTPASAAQLRSRAIISASAGEYSKPPPRGRIMHIIHAPRAWHRSTAASITPRLGVVPPTARLSHSSILPAPASSADGTLSRFSAQNSRRTTLFSPATAPPFLLATLSNLTQRGAARSANFSPPRVWEAMSGSGPQRLAATRREPRPWPRPLPEHRCRRPSAR